MKYYFRPGHPKASGNGFVSETDLGDEPYEPKLAINAGIMAGRFYENLGKTTDGVPINSRRDLREHMKRANVTHMSDFTETWKKAAKEREQHRQGGTERDRRERKEALARAIYQGRH